MTGSQNCSSYPVSNTCPAGQASALLLCSEDNTYILSFDKLFHCYYHCCKSLAYSNYGESCRCSYKLSICLQVYPAGTEILWSHTGPWSASNAYPLHSTWCENGGMGTTVQPGFLVPTASWHGWSFFLSLPKVGYCCTYAERRNIISSWWSTSGARTRTLPPQYSECCWPLRHGPVFSQHANLILSQLFKPTY